MLRPGPEVNYIGRGVAVGLSTGGAHAEKAQESNVGGCSFFSRYDSLPRGQLNWASGGA